MLPLWENVAVLFFALNYLRASRFPSSGWWELSIKNKQFIIDCYLNILQTENHPEVDVVLAFLWRRRTAWCQWWRGPASGGEVPASPGLGHQWGEDGAWDWQADQFLCLQWCSRCGEGAEPNGEALDFPLDALGDDRQNEMMGPTQRTSPTSSRVRHSLGL